MASSPIPFAAGELLALAVIAVLAVVLAGRIVRKAGFPTWLGLAVLIPILNLALFV